MVGVLASSCASDTRKRTRAAGEPSFCGRFDTPENRATCSKFIPRLLEQSALDRGFCGFGAHQLAVEAVSWSTVAYPCFVDGLYHRHEEVRDLSAAMLLHIGCEGRVLAWCAERDDEPTLCTTTAPLFEPFDVEDRYSPGSVLTGHVTYDGRSPPAGWSLSFGPAALARVARLGFADTYVMKDAPIGRAVARLTFKAGYRIERQEVRTLEIGWEEPSRRHHVQDLAFESGPATLVVHFPPSAGPLPLGPKLDLEQLDDPKQTTRITASLQNRRSLRLPGLREGRYRVTVSAMDGPYWQSRTLIEEEVVVATSTVTFEIPNLGPES